MPAKTPKEMWSRSKSVVPARGFIPIAPSYLYYDYPYYYSRGYYPTHIGPGFIYYGHPYYKSRYYLRYGSRRGRSN